MVNNDVLTTPTRVIDSHVQEIEDADNQEFMTTYAEVIEPIRGYNDLVEKAVATTSDYSLDIEALLGPKKETKTFLGLPCSKHADFILSQVNSHVSRWDNLLSSSRSFKLLPPPLP